MDTNHEQPQAEAAQRSAQHEVLPTEVQRVKHPGGRPTKYTPQLAQAIMADFAQSPDSIDVICGRHDISTTRFWAWVQDNMEFRDLFAQARTQRAHALVHGDHTKLQELEIKAETASNEELRRIDLQSRIHRIRIGRNQWMAERMNPKQFASQQHVDVTQRALNVHLHADTPEDVQAMAQRLEELEDTPT